MRKREEMNQKLFISYRRADSTDFAGRLYDNLNQNYSVFFDTEDGIGAGERFLNVITKSIQEADIFLMVIGEDSGKEFKVREEQDDYVLKEIIEAKKSSCFIIPILKNGVKKIEYLPKEIEFIRALSYYEFSHTKFSLNLKGLKKEIEKYHPKLIKIENNNFVQDVISSLERERLLVLFSQDFTPIDSYLNQIKELLSTKFNKNFYQISVPSYVEDEEEYFTSIAEDCGFLTTTKINGWNREIRNRLKSSSKPLLLFVEDIEDGNEELDKRFATSLRNLKNKFNHFHLICVGKKGLANLVHGEGHLSPLNNAKELFFPEDGFILGEEKIVQQFNTLGKNPKLLCKYLNKDELVLFSTWSRNDTINQLFWRNLLVKRGKRFVWRGERTKELGREVLGCDGDVV